jgi:hypothetical protein
MTLQQNRSESTVHEISLDVKEALVQLIGRRTFEVRINGDTIANAAPMNVYMPDDDFCTDPHQWLVEFTHDNHGTFYLALTEVMTTDSDREAIEELFETSYYS